VRCINGESEGEAPFGQVLSLSERAWLQVSSFMEAGPAQFQVPIPRVRTLRPRPLRRPRRLDAGGGAARPRRPPRHRRGPGTHRPHPRCHRYPGRHHQNRMQVPHQEAHGPARMPRL